MKGKYFWSTNKLEEELSFFLDEEFPINNEELKVSCKHTYRLRLTPRTKSNFSSTIIGVFYNAGVLHFYLLPSLKIET